jgi:hypothetical protein
MRQWAIYGGRFQCGPLLVIGLIFGSSSLAGWLGALSLDGDRLQLFVMAALASWFREWENWLGLFRESSGSLSSRPRQDMVCESHQIER